MINLKNLFHSKNYKCKSKGKIGEDLACKFLKKNTYAIVEKNYRSRYGEVDIIASESDTLCFIEVKARSSTNYGLPEEFVDKKKQQKIIKSTLSYLEKKNESEKNVRFDIVSVDLEAKQCRLIKNAFDADF